jgi:hypothetical protein
MESLYVTGPRPKATRFQPLALIEYAVDKIFAKGKLAADLSTSTPISKYGLKDEAVPTLTCQSFYSEDIDVRSILYLLANNPTTPPALLDHIAASYTVAVSEAVAMNENTSRTTLCCLSNHDSPIVRAAVTENRYAPIEILSQLSEDEHPDVRFAMAENPDLPKVLLAKLATDENPFVASRANTTLERLTKKWEIL